MIPPKFRMLFPNGIFPGTITPFAHKGEWAVHELLPVFFSQAGKFNLDIATFNVSEESLRPIFFMKDSGQLLSTRFIFDNNIQRHKLDLLLFTSVISGQVHVAANHMKVMLCYNNILNMAVVGSANMNRNIRHEAGFITTETNSFNYFRDYFNHVFTNDSVPIIIDEI
jgi:hypothetical protein